MKLNPRIIAASGLGIAMVAVAFVVSLNKESAPVQSSTSMTLKQKNVREFINTGDNNKDGIPDWQESLDIPTVYLNEENEVPTATMTKTASLAVGLVSHSYIGTQNQDSTAQEIDSLIDAASIDHQYNKSDIAIGSFNDTNSLRLYGNRVAAITFDFAPPSGTQNELTVVNRALSREDSALLAELDPTIDSYESMIEAMLNTSVPPLMVREHLALINVYSAILHDIKAFRLVFEDAFPSMVRLRRYQADTEALYLAISTLYLKLDQAGVEWTENDTASKFISIE